MTDRPELQKDANGLFPGEAQHGIPDFLRRLTVTITDVNDGPSLYDVIAERLSPATDPQASPPTWVPPWQTKI